MKHYIYILLLVLCSGISAFAQSEVSCKIKQGYDRMFYNTNNPKIEFGVYNTSDYEGFNSGVSCKVENYEGEPVYEFFQKFYVAPSDSTTLGFSFKVDPGFYRIILEKDGNIIEKAVMGYEPEMLEFAESDNLPAIKEKWQNSLNSLKSVPFKAVVTRVKKTGGKLRNTYNVVLRSTDNAIIEGYYTVPKQKGIYPVVITCTDKDEELFMPDGNSNADRIDFVVAPRSEGLGSEEYYYNICMDVIRSIDFVMQRTEVDLKNIFLHGRGRGAALAIGTAALDSRVTAVAAYAPALANGRMDGKDQDYDIKHLSGEVKCPVLMGVGLEDTICPPHLNFEIYNPIKSVKEYYIFVNGHEPTELWSELADNFYSKYKR